MLPDYEIYGSIVYEVVDIVKTIVRKKLHKKKGDILLKILLIYS